MASTTGQKIFKGTLIAAGALLAINWLRKKSSADSLIFLPGSIDGIYWDGFTPFVSLGIIVQNTSNQSYTISSIAGNVSSNVNGKIYNLGNVSTFTQQQILANSQQTIKVDIRLSLIGIVSDIINMINQGFRQTITLEGSANVENLQIPLKFDYSI